MQIEIDKIKIKKRVRKEIGDISRLMNSMQRVGLINPVTVTGNKELIAGYRRMEAAKQLGWKVIDCHIVDPRSRLEYLLIEADENNQRKEFTPEEKLEVDRLRTFYSTGIMGKIRIVFREILDAITGFFLRLLAKLKSKN